MKYLESLFGADVRKQFDDYDYEPKQPARETRSFRAVRSADQTGDLVKDTNAAYLDWLRDSAYLLKLAEFDDTNPDILARPEFKTWAKELRAVLVKAPKSVVSSKKTIDSSDFADLWFMQPKESKTE